jgi:hypothetical protein
MSRRHQANRRKTYGRRQHEVRERQERRHHPEAFEIDLEAWGSAAPTDPFSFLDPRLPRLHYAGD